MGLLSSHESIVWQKFQRGKNTSSIAEENNAESWSPAYVSRVLNRARKKIAKALKEHANSHRALFYLAKATFQREEILTKWK